MDAMSALPPVDRTAALRLWAEYARTARDTILEDSALAFEQFGDSPELADELLALVIDGRKRATSSLLREFALRADPVPSAGDHWVACDGAGAPQLVLRTTHVRIGAFASVDESFAYDEGEGERTVASWQDDHRRFWSRVCAAQGHEWTEEEPVVFERFRVVWPPERADQS